MTAIVVALGLGMLFGAILQRVQASSPDRIIDTLALKDLTILKFMLLAVGVGAFGIGLLTAAGVAHLDIKPLALLAVGAGGLIFGVGFGIGGYCPGTCLAGAAEGRRDALFTILGGLAGALGYGLLDPVVGGALRDRLSFGEMTLPSVIGWSPLVIGTVFGALMVALSFLLPRSPRRAGGAG